MSKQFGSFITEELLSEIGIIEVGIFEAKQRKKASKGLKNLGKGKARKVSVLSSQTTADVLEILDNKYKILSNPLENQNTKEHEVFMDSLIEYSNDKTAANSNKIKNSLKAVIVKPILTSVYGYNTQKTADKKGFNKLLVDTGQTVKAIKVKINGN
jgi:hypothetical protein